MASSGAARRIAMVGMGPRGLGSLEALAALAPTTDARFAVDVFEPGAAPGAGPNFSPDEADSCLLNLPVRSVSLPPPRAGGGPGDFADWLQPGRRDPERFPPRAELGDYLAARLQALAARLPDGIRLSLFRAQATRIVRQDGAWRLETDGGRPAPYAEALLNLGQPETEPDEQLAAWRRHAAARGLDLLPAYPGADLLTTAGRWQDATVGIRGLGLSTLDIVRLLTVGLGGRFADGGYRASGREPARIVAFSPDGHAPAPKPNGAAIDARFEPLPPETAAFERALATALAASPDAATAAICAALAPPALRILKATGAEADTAAVAAWLEIERERPGDQETRTTIEALCLNIAYADGAAPPSVGYVVGQVWRKWQGPLRRAFRLGGQTAATAAALVGFDESLKRYSFGPPRDSAMELAILIQNGLVRPCAAADSDVALVDGGWRLDDDGRRFDMTAMVDGVQPPPALESIVEPVLARLRQDFRLAPVAEGLGARTATDGQILDRDGRPLRGLCLLGRLSLGSVIAADSIHDCFGDDTKRWAEGVIARATA